MFPQVYSNPVLACLKSFAKVTRIGYGVEIYTNNNREPNPAAAAAVAAAPLRWGSAGLPAPCAHARPLRILVLALHTQSSSARRSKSR